MKNNACHVMTQQSLDVKLFGISAGTLRDYHKQMHKSIALFQAVQRTFCAIKEKR